MQINFCGEVIEIIWNLAYFFMKVNCKLRLWKHFNFFHVQCWCFHNIWCYFTFLINFNIIILNFLFFFAQTPVNARTVPPMNLSTPENRLPLHVVSPQQVDVISMEDDEFTSEGEHVSLYKRQKFDFKRIFLWNCFIDLVCEWF